MLRNIGRDSVKYKLAASIILLILLMSLPLTGGEFLGVKPSRAFDNHGQEMGLNGLNVTLCVKDWKERVSFEGLKVVIYDLKEWRASTHFSNRTGYVTPKLLPPGSYVIFVQKGERTVGYKKIYVTENENFTIRTWSYDLNLTLVDEWGKPLANHTVFLRDQTSQKMVTVGVGNGTRTVFHMGHPYIIRGTVKVYLDGVLTKDYTLDYTSGKLIFNSPPSNGTEITADYSYWIPDAGEVKRASETIIRTEEAGQLVAEAETDENGTVRFPNVWNGTYRLTVLGKERWLEQYVLGEKVLTRVEPAEGDFIINVQDSMNITLRCIRSDLTLRLVTKSNVPVRNATVEVRSRGGHLLYKDQTNSTGFIERKNIYVADELYTISARIEERIIDREVINLTEPKLLTLKCWTNNLTVTCLDQEGKPLVNHLVFLYDQLIFYSPENFTLITDHTGSLVNITRTDENGKAYFKDLWNGTYQVRVVAGRTVGTYTIDLQKTDSVAVKCNRTYMTLTLITWSGEPLPGATIRVYGGDGYLFLRDRSDQYGIVRWEGVYLDNYTIHVEWMGTEVWSGVVDLRKNREMTLRCRVYRLTFECRDPFGKKIDGADITLKKEISRRRSIVISHLETDEQGSISLLLPYGSYVAYCSYGIYSGSTRIMLDRDHVERIICNVRSGVWTPIVMVALLIVVSTIFLERRNLRIPLEIRRYKTMLSKLESMYRTGQVEYSIYRKIKEELEAKLMELGGREIR